MVNQYDIYWIKLDPTIGSEINKIRPGVIISPNESNRHLNTVIIAPITTTLKTFPMRVEITLKAKNGQVALDQIRSIDKRRLLNKMGSLKQFEIENLKHILREYLIE